MDSGYMSNKRVRVEPSPCQILSRGPRGVGVCPSGRLTERHRFSAWLSSSAGNRRFSENVRLFPEEELREGLGILPCGRETDVLAEARFGVSTGNSGDS